MNGNPVRRYVLRVLCHILFAGLLAIPVVSQNPGSLSPEMRQKVDDVVHGVLTVTGAPSASIAVVKDRQLVYAQAYGNARLEPVLAAKPEMRYSIGSISKQFTAAAILLLAEQGKLTLDDPVNKYVPDVTRADEVTIRQVLSHTSGYQDYWPQDYVPPFMLQSVTAQKILDLWAKKPLDFEPGTKWQYSNTNFVIAGLIVEKVAGMPLLQFLGQHVFTPLGMTSIADTNENKLPPTDPAGYLRYGLGPLRPAPKEGKGWMFAAGELAMTASDLAKWDISIMNQSVLKPASYRQLGTEVLLKNGVGTGYGLGVEISSVKGHRQLEHSGEVSGFTAENIVLPDDGIAVIVQVNQDAVGASGQIGRRVRDTLLAQLNPEDEKQRVLAEQIFADLQQGKIDRSRFTSNANAYFDEQALQDYARGLGSLGLPKSFEQKISEGRGGMTFRAYEVKFPDRTLGILVYEMPDGKFEQFQVNMVQ